MGDERASCGTHCTRKENLRFLVIIQDLTVNTKIFSLPYECIPSSKHRKWRAVSHVKPITGFGRYGIGLACHLLVLFQVVAVSLKISSSPTSQRSRRRAVIKRGNESVKLQANRDAKSSNSI